VIVNIVFLGKHINGFSRDGLPVADLIVINFWQVNGFPRRAQQSHKWIPIISVMDCRGDFSVVVCFGKYITDGWMASGRRLVRFDGQDVSNL
jgi:hypothetical protein